MPGAWLDADGNGHIDVYELHNFMRGMGLPIQDTPEEIEDTIRVLTHVLEEHHCPNIMVRRSPND